ncbi:MAG: pyridoxamine 5'-phosphate oxidase [Vicingaceae bacterium]
MNEDLANYINEVRRDFSGKPLNEDSVLKNPLNQFNSWFEEAVNAQILDPYAMSLTTVNAIGQPSNRIVYMRDITDYGFIFYTNYNSTKGKDLSTNNKVALNFFWGELERQIRIEGEVEKVTAEVSDNYFAKRPRESQVGAWASNQSEEIESRLTLEEKIAFYTTKFKGIEIPRPAHWGGYIVNPKMIEFWQGRPSRLHDRIVYTKNGVDWRQTRVSP